MRKPYVILFENDESKLMEVPFANFSQAMQMMKNLSSSTFKEGTKVKLIVQSKGRALLAVLLNKKLYWMEKKFIFPAIES